MLDDVPPYVERFVKSQLDAIAAVKEEPTEAPSSCPATDLDLSLFTPLQLERLTFYKWLYEQGRLAESC